MENRRNKEATLEDALTNMVDYIGDFIENLHRKDKDAVKLITNNADTLQENFLELMEELIKADEWKQEDLMELTAITLLLATIMGIPESVDDGEDDNDGNEETPESEDESSVSEG